MAKGSSSSKGPDWKPAKSSVSGNYGKAVSAAAKAKAKPERPEMPEKSKRKG